MDDFLKMLFDEAAKTARQTPPPRNPFSVSIDIEKEAEKSAKLAKTLYDAFVGVGFTAEQSFTLTQNIVSPKR